MPYFNTQRGRWMAQVLLNGVKHRSQHDTKAEARQWEAEKKKELESAPAASSSFTLGTFSRSYLEYAQRFSVKTLAEKKLAFRLLFKSIAPETPAASLHKGDALAHFARQAQARSGYAANKDRKNLAAAWNWAVQYLSSFPQQNPFLTERFPEDRCARCVPPEKDFWAVHNKAESERDRLMLLCFLHLAARKQ